MTDLSPMEPFIESLHNRAEQTHTGLDSMNIIRFADNDPNTYKVPTNNERLAEWLFKFYGAGHHENVRVANMFALRFNAKKKKEEEETAP